MFGYEFRHDGNNTIGTITRRNNDNEEGATGIWRKNGND